MSFMQPGALCFDIGANIGQSADQFLKAGAGHVVSVEPCIENFLVLSRMEKVTALHAACWSKRGFVEAYFSYNEPGWSSVQPKKWECAYPKASWSKAQPVVAVTLNMIRLKYGDPFLVKIDVEGSEKEVLMGMDWKPPFLFFEFHGKFVQDALDCLLICQRIGYTKAHYVRENLDLETVPTMPIDEFRPRWLADSPEWGNITVI